MNDYENTIRTRGKTLLIVEGHHEKDKLFSTILHCFPEIQIDRNNIWVYGTNIYSLYDDITKEYGSNWDTNDEDIDLPFIISKKQTPDSPQFKDDFTDIILVFDYERHDPKYSIRKIEALQSIFNDSANMGKLYINYPMIESYLYLQHLPDENYINQKIPTTLQPGHKIKQLIKNNSCLTDTFNFPIKIDDYLDKDLLITDETVRKELIEKVLKINKEEDILFYENIFKGVIDENKLQSFKYQCKDWVNKIGHTRIHQSYWIYMRNIMKQIIFHNITKAYYIQHNIYDVQKANYIECYKKIDFIKILHKQNDVSTDSNNGFIWVLNTCILFVADYNFQLLLI